LISPNLTILVVDDETNMRRIMEATLQREGFKTLTASNGKIALEILETEPVHIILTDLKMPVIDGMTLLRECSSRYPEIPLIMLTAHGTVETAVEAMKIGAYDYISKPFDIVEIRHALKKASGRYLHNRESYLVGEDFSLENQSLQTSRTCQVGGIIAASEQMRDLLDLVDLVADSPSTILITGESGTGKELIAGLIHKKSSRKNQPLIKVNCAAIPETLLESEFFGHERGAFTGAVTSKPGRFELADNGTLFLDEISEISMEIQVKLLRAIQEQEFERVGGIKTLNVDVRLVAATNLDIAEEVDQGRFRQDLFYRLNVVPIHIPPLRNRIQDIPALVDYFLIRMNARLNRSVKRVTPMAMKVLLAHSWPGNIRELENVIERAVLLCNSDEISAENLNVLSKKEQKMKKQSFTEPSAKLDNGVDYKQIILDETNRIERILLVKTLRNTGGNVTRSAKQLGLSRKGLQLKIHRLGINPRELPEMPDFSLT